MIKQQILLLTIFITSLAFCQEVDSSRLIVIGTDTLEAVEMNVDTVKKIPIGQRLHTDSEIKSLIQENRNMRHHSFKLRRNSGATSLYLKYMIQQNVINYGLSFYYQHNETRATIISAEYEELRFSYTSGDYYRLGVGQNVLLANFSDLMFLSAEAGGYLNILNLENSELNYVSTEITPLAKFSFNSEFFLSDNITLVGTISQYFDPLSPIGTWYYNFGGGLKLNF